MQKKNIVVSNITDKYNHLFSEIVRIACQFQSKIMITDGEHQVNAKSIMGVMAFGLTDNMQFTVAAEGSDESEAIQTLESFFAQ